VPEFESQGFQGLWMPSRRLDGRHGILVVLKRSWSIDGERGLCHDDGESDPIRMTPVLVDPEQPTTSDLAYPADTAPEKARVDILVTAEACAPGGSATPSFEVGVAIADVLDRRLQVLGPRHAVHVPTRVKKKKSEDGKPGSAPPTKPPKFTEPEAVAALPLSYAYAYGGAAALVLDDETRAAFDAARSTDGDDEEAPGELPDVSYPANPAGLGFCISAEKEAIDGLALPQLEALDGGLEPESVVQDFASLDLQALPAPPGFAPYPVAWFPRAAYAGVMPWDLEAAKKARDAVADSLAEREDMEDAWVDAVRDQEIPVMRVDWYQDAHPDLQVERVLGDEVVTLEHLSRHGVLSFPLPGRHPWATIQATGIDSAVALTLDTVHFDLSDDLKPRLHLVWRGFHVLPSADAVAAASDAQVAVRDLPQPLWLLRRQELLGTDEPASEDAVAQVGTARIEVLEDDAGDQ
jgi:hypothetical protein